ncbi:MAG: glycosyltransferase family 4 protein, partial [Acidimicrobiia bacterium]
VLDRAAVVTAVSRAAAVPLEPFRRTVRIIPNGLDLASFRVDVPRHPRRVAFVGRDDPRKGLDVLLEAWPDVRRSVPDSELVVAGGSRVAVPEGARFLGRVGDDQKRRVMAGAAILCAPNMGGESFGVVVAEGLAAGCAVVASDLAVFRHVAGEAACYVEPGRPRALAEAIIRLLLDLTERARLGAAGRVRAARYDWSVVLPAYREAYREAVERSGAVGPGLP